MNENYTNNNEMLIQYIDAESGKILTTQQTAIASVILESLSMCSYIVINGVDYIFVESKLLVSQNELDKNIYQIFIEDVENYRINNEKQ